MPIGSWILLKGRCRYCGAAIGAGAPVAEGVCGLLFCAALFVSGATPYMVAQSLFFAGLFAAGLIDIKMRVVPNKLNIALAAFGVLAGVIVFWQERAAGLPLASNLYETVLPRVLGAVCVPGFMLIAAVITKGFGGGDIKLLAAVGLFLGLRQSVMAAALSFVIAGCFAAYLLIIKKAGRKSKIAFAPFISIAAVIVSIVNI